jgi:hypothetical protein
MKEKRNAYEISENLRGRYVYDFGDQGIDGRKILSWILRQ